MKYFSIVRRIIAALSIILITLLFLDFTGTLHLYLGWMAKMQLLPAAMAVNVVVLVVMPLLTLVFGRLYCSVICPLGIMQDVMARFNRKKNKYSYSPAKTWLRIFMLVFYVAAILVGIGFLSRFFAPYSSYGRIVSNLFQPFYLWGNNVLATIAEHYESYTFYHVDVWMRSLLSIIIALCTFIILFILSWKGGRTYCNTLCPAGTLLGFFSRFSFVGIKLDSDKCRKCGKCAKNCKASCIDTKTMTVDKSRCVMCGNCLTECKFDALHLAAGWGCRKPVSGRTTTNETTNSGSNTRGTTTSHDGPELSDATSTAATPVDQGRRAFLMGAAMVTSGAVMAQAKKKVDGGLAAIEEKEVVKRNTPITPPGSLSASNFNYMCTGCQLCIDQCPNQVLRPSSDLMSLMQPTMSYERGYCRPECNRCSQVCPASAITPITLDVKNSTQIGHAVWIKKNCISAIDGIPCGNCARHCPAGAITMVQSDENDPDSPMIPAVNESACIGCGACEHLCPARPTAIYVEGHEVHKMI